ncbi:MAG: hypothetical protein ACSLE6_03110 [Mycobacterium sp.]
MFDQMMLAYDSDATPPRRQARRHERMREVTTRITHSRGINERKRRVAEAERTLARARRARQDAQRFQEQVAQWRASESAGLPARGHPRLTGLPS